MKAITLRELQIDTNPIERNKTLKVRIKLEEYERGQYARQSGSQYIDLYAGESLGRA